jgi:hypothetical protein
MPVYRIYRLNDTQRTKFRWAPHTSGLAQVKPKDYEEDGTIEALSPYAAWHELKAGDSPLDLGDLLENPDGEVSICKYVGFEAAQWVLPEVKTGLEAVPPAAGRPQFQAG